MVWGVNRQRLGLRSVGSLRKCRVSLKHPFALASGGIVESLSIVRLFTLLILVSLALMSGAQAQQRCATPVVIPNVKGNSTTTKFGEGYITRTAEGTTYNTSKFGSGWITRSSDGKSYTTTKFGDGAITRGNGQQVTTSRFGSGTINRSSDGTTTTTQKFGDGSISRSTGGASVTSSRFGSGYISRENGSAKEKEKGVVRVIPIQK
jgi:hypothetical protein